MNKGRQLAFELATERSVMAEVDLALVVIARRFEGREISHESLT
jgi:hypothetical protein